MNTMSPRSTCGKNASCCALLKRCTSSTNTIVRRPLVRRRAASAITVLISLIPLITALKGTKSLRVVRAMIVANVVFPHPGGPQKSIELIWSLSICVRSGLPGASRCSCPRNSSSVRGRIRSASGPAASCGSGSGSIWRKRLMPAPAAAPLHRAARSPPSPH